MISVKATPGGVPKSSHDINAMMEEVAEWLVEKGWNDDRTFGDELILIVSELIEALEAYRSHGFQEWFTWQPTVMRGNQKVKLPKMTEDQLEALGIPTEMWGPKRREGAAAELAGTLVRLLDTCSRHGFKPGLEFRDEMDYNWSRSYRHGGRAL